MIRQKKNSGFTLAELLIVVAVVGILVAISIPVFTSQLHKAKVATDEANLRSYYSVLMADYQATGKYDYDPSITDDMWKNISNTIKYKDGTTVKLKAKFFRNTYTGLASAAANNKFFCLIHLRTCRNFIFI